MAGSGVLGAAPRVKAARRRRYELQLGPPCASLLEQYAATRMGGGLRGASIALQLLEMSLCSSTYKSSTASCSRHLRATAPNKGAAHCLLTPGRL